MRSSILKRTLKLITACGTVALLLGCAESAPKTGPQDAAPHDISQAQTKLDSSRQASSLSEPHRKLLEQRIEAGSGVGLAVALVDNNNQDYIFAGQAAQDSEQSIDENSLFEIGSITKTFTGLLLADMVLKGEVNLDDAAAKHLPEGVTLPQKNGRSITLKDLATHSSGLPRLPANINPEDPSNPYADYTLEQLYAFLSSYTLEADIGGQVDYSNLGMGLLGHILERRTGQSYEALVTERILNPLSMSSTFITVPKDKQANFVTGHDIAGEPAAYWDIPTLAGAGALRSTISDMTLYLKANMGIIETPLSDAIAMSHKFQQALSEGNDDAGHIGLAWFTQNMDGQLITWHNGGTGGFKSFLGFDPKHKRGVVVLANAQDDTDLIGRATLTNKPDLLKPNVVDPALNFTAVQLEAFVGDFQLAPSFIITISRVDTRLFLQATGQGKAEIFPKSKLEFFLKVVDASIIFTQDDKGEITSLILNQGGMLQPAKRL